MTDFKILSIDTETKQMVVDWGFVTLNHDIPLYILENPGMSQAEMLEHIGYMRPPVPVDLPVPITLLDLKEPEPQPTLEDMKVLKMAEIENWRIQAERSGMPWHFGTIEDIVQVRHERDLANINGQVSAALVLKGRGVTQAVLPFRAQSNITHNLTPDEMIDMGMAVGEFTADQYMKAWALKEQVAAATTAEELDALVWPA